MNLTAFSRHVCIRDFAKTKTFTVMKLTAIILLVGCLQVSAAGYSQKVSISRKNASLETVFRDIKKQTGYLFFYNAKILEAAHEVNIDLKDVPLTDALKETLKGQPFTYSIVNNTIVITYNKEVAAPQINTLVQVAEVRGKVVDDKSGQPVIGATIAIKGAKQILASNSKGEFVIPYTAGMTITVSSVGYESEEIKVTDTSYITVRLTLKPEALDKTIVTGYQVIKKDNFTGTAITVSGEDLKKMNPQNMLQSISVYDPSFKIIENNILGSNPNSLPNITVRGSTALPSGAGDVLSRDNLKSNVNLPTFIMDGYEVSLEKVYDLDINRVQSITVLKDAAATAVYGSRAANGVVVITTKAPKEGKLQVSYNYELNVTSPDLSDYHVLNATDKLEYERLAGLYDQRHVAGASQDDLDALYYKRKEMVVGGVNTYWLSQPLKTAIGNKNSLYIEGGTGTMRYGLELRYQTSPGVMKGSGRDRYSAGLSLSYNPGKKILFRNSLTVTQVDAKESPYGSFASYVSMNPYYPKTDSAGNIIRVIDKWPGTNLEHSGQVLNPMYDATLASFNRTKYLELIDALSLEWSITNNLRLRGLVSLTKTKTDQDAFTSPLANQFFYYSTQDIKKRGQYTYGNDDRTAVDGNVMLNYNKQLGGHFINFALGSNIRSVIDDYKAFTAIGFSNDRFTNIGYANAYPEASTPYSAYQQERLVGFLASLNYTYRNKYLLDFSFREDGSSKFGKDNKMAPFGALGVGWNIHKEDFFRSKVISQLKLRTGIGVTGAVSFPPDMAITTYNYYTSNWYSTGVGASVNNIGNDSLQWQKTQNFDVGLDLGLLNDRIIISPRYYYKYTKGMLSDIILAPSTGSSTQKANLGDVENYGAELNVRAVLYRQKNWNISVFANMTANRNQVKKISNSLKKYNDNADTAQVGSMKGIPLVRYAEGQSLDAIYAVKSMGIDPQNGREIFMKKDGSLTYDWDVKDNMPIAVTTPKAEGYFGASFSYKGFMLNATFYTKFGGYLYNQTLVDRVENADPKQNVDQRVFAERWRTAGDKTFYKDIANVDQTQTTSRFVQKDNVLQVQSVYFSYDFDKKAIEKTGMKNLRLALTANDVWRWSSVKTERGIDYPFARSVTFSLQTYF